VTEPISEVMRVLTRLLLLEIDDLSDRELSEIVRMTKDSRPLRSRAAVLLKERGWSLEDMAGAWRVDPVTAWRWTRPPSERRPGERPPPV
jgi:hypothetical protein